LKEHDPDLNKLTADIWTSLLEDYPFGEIKLAFKQYAKMNKFAPQVSDLIGLVEKMRNPTTFLSSEEAWEIASKAVRKFGFHKQSEAFAAFDPKMKRVVKAIGWWNLCYSERLDQLKKNFCSLWDNISQSEKEELALPFHRAVHIMKKYGEINEPKK